MTSPLVLPSPHSLHQPFVSFLYPTQPTMEATLFSFPSYKPPPSRSQTRLLTPFFHSIPNNNLTFRKRHRFFVNAAISRTKKEEIVETVKTQLENCHFIAAIQYQGLTVKQFEDLRRALPESSTLLVAKNRLVYKAIEGTKFAALKPCMKGMNAFMFVHSEEIPAAIKPFRDFQKGTKIEANDFAGAVFEGKYYGPEDFKALETLPTREEIYAKILGALQSPAMGLVGTIQAPARDVLMVLKAYVKKLEDEGGQ